MILCWSSLRELKKAKAVMKMDSQNSVVFKSVFKKMLFNENKQIFFNKGDANILQHFMNLHCVTQLPDASWIILIILSLIKPNRSGLLNKIIIMTLPINFSHIASITLMRTLREIFLINERAENILRTEKILSFRSKIFQIFPTFKLNIYSKFTFFFSLFILRLYVFLRCKSILEN